MKLQLREILADTSVTYSLLFRMWSILSGACLVLLIPFSLSGIEQGYYFTFSSLLAMQVFFELGLNVVLLQIVSHERANISFDESGNLIEKGEGSARLGKIISTVRKAYLLLSIGYSVIVSAVGFLFFTNTQQGQQELIIWLPVWIPLVFGTALNLYLSPFLTIIEALGQVGQVARAKLTIGFFATAFFWIALLTGFGLKALLIAPFVNYFSLRIWLGKKFKNVLHIQSQEPNLLVNFSWRQEIFPMQWRVALSWMSGYFIGQLINPIIFKNFGAEVAGRFGLSLTIFLALGSLSYSWVNAKVPDLGRLLAQNQIQQMKQLFWKVLKGSTGLIVAMCVVLILSICVMQELNINFAHRFADVKTLLALTLLTIVNHLVFSAAAFMRVQKREPMLFNSIVSAIIVTIAMLIGARHSASAVIWANMLVATFVSFPWTILLFRKYYNKVGR